MQELKVEAAIWYDTKLVLPLKSDKHKSKNIRTDSYYLRIPHDLVTFHKLKEGDMLHINIMAVERAK